MRLPLFKAGFLFSLLVSASVVAATPGGTIRGTVKTKAGLPIARATVVARASDGRTLASVSTDSRGHFQFPPIRPGFYRVEVECRECREPGTKTVVIKNEAILSLNFVMAPSVEGPLTRFSLLGPVSFDTSSDYKGGGLKDPSAGGGYSDAVSAQAGKMVNQYLARQAAPRPPSRSAGLQPGISPTVPAPRGGAGATSADLERSGGALLAEGKYMQAIPVFETAVIDYPRSERLRTGLGLSLYGAGEFAAASQSLRAAARLAPGDPSPILLLAEASRFAPNPASLSLLKNFSDLHPQSEAGHYAYGLALWGENRAHHDRSVLTQAQRQFEKSVALDSSDSSARLYLGMVYDEQGATERAVREYMKATEASPSPPIAHYRLARDYERLGERDKAAAEFARYEKLRRHASP